LYGIARAEKPAAAYQKRPTPMDATANFSLRFAPASYPKVETTNWAFSRQVLQRIATRISLVSEAIGFLVLGTLIILNRHQADLNGFSGGSSFAMIGGISALLVGTIFLVAACVHWKFRAKHPATLPVRRHSLRFSFARPNPVTAMALVSA
jgi:hypothetical protein